MMIRKYSYIGAQGFSNAPEVVHKMYNKLIIFIHLFILFLKFYF
jgi:hypothetical protein